MKVMDGDWYETPYGLLRVAKVMKSALICWMYLPHMRIEEVILCTDQMAEWKLLGRRKFQPDGIVQWVDSEGQIQRHSPPLDCAASPGP